MPADPVETVRAFFQALGEVPADPVVRARTWEHFATEDIVYVEDPKWPGAGRYEGREAVARCWEGYVETIGTATRIELHEVQAAGDRMIAIVTVAGRSRDAEIPYSHTWGYVCETAGDRLSYLRAHFDPDDARA